MMAHLPLHAHQPLLAQMGNLGTHLPQRLHAKTRGAYVIGVIEVGRLIRQVLGALGQVLDIQLFVQWLLLLKGG